MIIAKYGLSFDQVAAYTELATVTNLTSYNKCIVKQDLSNIVLYICINNLAIIIELRRAGSW